MSARFSAQPIVTVRIGNAAASARGVVVIEKIPSRVLDYARLRRRAPALEPVGMFERACLLGSSAAGGHGFIRAGRVVSTATVAPREEPENGTFEGPGGQFSQRFWRRAYLARRQPLYCSVASLASRGPALTYFVQVVLRRSLDRGVCCCGICRVAAIGNSQRQGCAGTRSRNCCRAAALGLRPGHPTSRRSRAAAATVRS